jgi:SAM-dependent methyltransferase
MATIKINSKIVSVLEFQFDKKQLSIKTSNLDRYIKWLWQQNAGDPRWDTAISKDEQHKLTALICWEKFHWFHSCLKTTNVNLANVKKIIDVGSGLGAIDILSSQLMPETNFYLVDRDCITITEESNYFSQSITDLNYHGFYNSFDAIKDAAQYSLQDSSKINFLDPTDDWPDKVDVVFSLFSWMWHYHKDVYWVQLLKSLKVGGVLIVMINLREGENSIINKISQDLGSYPLSIQEVSHGPKNPDYYLSGADKVVHRACYVWQRMR